MKICIAGNSHVVSFAQANKNLGHDISFLGLGSALHERDRFSSIVGSGVRFTNEDYQRNLVRGTGTESISAGVVWGFVQVNHFPRVYRDPIWLRYRPAGHSSLGYQAVSEAVIREMLARDQMGIRFFYDQLLELGVSFAAISAPPPRRDHPAIERGVDATTVVEIDRMGRRMWREWLEDRAIPFVSPPDVTFDSDGFLLHQYAQLTTAKGERDPHHANAAYGHLALTRSLKRLSKLA